MDDLLQPDEKVIYRAKPAWRAVALLLGCGLSVALVLHVLVGLWDDNWSCPASLIVVIFLVPVTIWLVSHASNTAAIITNRRVLYRDGLADDFEALARSEIEQVELVASEFPVPSVQIRGQGGREMTTKLLAAPATFRAVLLGDDAAAAREQETIASTVLRLLAFTCAFSAAMNALFAVAISATPLLWRLLDFTPGSFGKTGDLLHDIAVHAVLLLIATFLSGPTLGLATLTAVLGYLPVLLLSRLLLRFEEARKMALIPRKVIEAAKPKDLASRWFHLWTDPLLRPGARFCETLVAWLYRQAIEPPSPT